MKTYTITNPSDIFSLILNVYGTLEESIKFISDNAALVSSLDADVSILPGEEVFYDTVLVVTIQSPKPVLSILATPVTAYNWAGREGQNIFDVCLQTYGVLDMQIQLMNYNKVDFDSTIYNRQFKYDSTKILNSNIWNRTTGLGYVFSSGN